MNDIFEQLLDAAARTEAERSALAASPMGLFHAFRADGLASIAFLDEFPGGAEMRRRLTGIFRAVGAGRRSDGMKDAYFVVRHPPAIHAKEAEPVAEEFVASALRILRGADQANEEKFRLVSQQAGEVGRPAIRILEGKPPKHPRRVEEQSTLMKLLTKATPEVLDGHFADHYLAVQLAEPLYYLACDAWLREYVRWPLITEHSNATESEVPAEGDDALSAYFELWRHGVKFRVFGNEQVDFYLPHREDGSLIDAGQFAFRRS